MSVAFKHSESVPAYRPPADSARYPVPGCGSGTAKVSLLSSLALSITLHLAPLGIFTAVHYLYGPFSKPPPGEVIVYSVSLESLASTDTTRDATKVETREAKKKVVEPFTQLKPRPERDAYHINTAKHAPAPASLTASTSISKAEHLAPNGSNEEGAALTTCSERAEAQMTDVRISYQQLIASLLNRAKRYPDSARRRRETGTGTIRIQLEPQGKVVRFNIVSSTGSASLDEELEAMVERAAPFPPFPQEIGVPSLTFTVPVSFRLQTP